MQSVLDIIRQLEDEDRNGKTVISKYVDFSMRETLDTIDAYINSRHTSGKTDSQGREKPFFNIVNAVVNIWYRATDLDRRHIRIKAVRQSQYLQSFLAGLLLRQWMRKAKFGVFLNKWGRTLSKYCSAVVKFVEKDELICEVVPWSRILCDPVDFDNNIQVERLWLTPAQLIRRIKTHNYDADMVYSLIDAQEKREIADGQEVDNKSGYIEIFEAHGEMPLSFLTDEEDDEDTFVQQMHVVAYTAKKDGAKKDFEDFTLYSGREKNSPYMITHLIAEDDRTLGIGPVELLFDSQWMVNHTAKTIKDQLDLASKLIYQTSDGNFVGQNALDAIENGDILIHQANQPLTQLNNASTDITSLQNYAAQWRALSSELSGTNEAMKGTNPPSGTPWRLTEALLQESHSLFELMIENKGLHLEDMLRGFIIPHLKKQMDTSEEISEILDKHNLDKIDSLYVPAKVNKTINNKYKEKVLNGEPVDPREMAMEAEALTGQIREELGRLGNQRFIRPSEIESKTWKEALKDLEWEVDVDVTGEERDSRSHLSTLSTIFQTIGSNPAILQNPQAKDIFNRILEITGAMSPLEISEMETAPMQGAPVPEMPAEQMIANK